jgi:hypothetical protein
MDYRLDRIREILGIHRDAFLDNGELWAQGFFNFSHKYRQATLIDLAYFNLELAIKTQEKKDQQAQERATYERLKQKYG